MTVAKKKIVTKADVTGALGKANVKADLIKALEKESIFIGLDTNENPLHVDGLNGVAEMFTKQLSNEKHNNKQRGNLDLVDADNSERGRTQQGIVSINDFVVSQIPNSFNQVLTCEVFESVVKGICKTAKVSYGSRKVKNSKGKLVKNPNHSSVIYNTTRKVLGSLAVRNRKPDEILTEWVKETEFEISSPDNQHNVLERRKIESIEKLEAQLGDEVLLELDEDLTARRKSQSFTLTSLANRENQLVQHVEHLELDEE